MVVAVYTHVRRPPSWIWTDFDIDLSSIEMQPHQNQSVYRAHDDGASNGDKKYFTLNNFNLIFRFHTLKSF